MASIFRFTDELSIGVWSVLFTLSEGKRVSDLELAKTLELPFTPSLIAECGSRSSFEMVFRNDYATHSPRVAASFRNAYFYEYNLRVRIPVLLMCDACCVISVLSHFRDKGIEPIFCSELVIELARLTLEDVK